MLLTELLSGLSFLLVIIIYSIISCWHEVSGPSFMGLSIDCLGVS